MNNPLITVLECLRALEQVFGFIDNLRELQVKCLTTYQKDEEKLSAYVLRLEPLLQELVETAMRSCESGPPRLLEQPAEHFAGSLLCQRMAQPLACGVTGTDEG